MANLSETTELFQLKTRRDFMVMRANLIKPAIATSIELRDKFEYHVPEIKTPRKLSAKNLPERITIKFNFPMDKIVNSEEIIAIAELLDEENEIYKIHSFKYSTAININNNKENFIRLKYPIEVKPHIASRSLKRIWVDNKSDLPSLLTKAIGKAIDHETGLSFY